MGKRKLAERLLLYRRELDLNQDELGELAKVDPSYISGIERNRRLNPSIDVVEALAAALGIRPEYLFRIPSVAYFLPIFCLPLPLSQPMRLVLPLTSRLGEGAGG